MIKKVLLIVSGLAAGVLFSALLAVETKAALPSTYDIIDDATFHVLYSTEGYERAKADELAKLAVFNAVAADPDHTQLEYEKAAADYANAVNVTKWWQQMIGNSNDFLKNIKGREAFEDKFAANKAALADLTTLQAAKAAADGAANIANAVADQIADVEKAIAGYTENLASCPSGQAAIDELNAKLAVLKADYAVKSADAAQKIAYFNECVNALNYGSYSVGFENYQYNREIQRDNTDWDPKGYY